MGLDTRKRVDVATGSVAAPNPYVTGGLALDLAQTFAEVLTFDTICLAIGNLGVHHIEHSIAGTVVTLKWFQDRYDNVTAIGNASGQPAGVTLATGSGQVVANENAHLHAVDHDHPSFTSGAAIAGTSGVATVGGTAAMTTHSHPIDIDNFTGQSGAGGAHNHADNNLYAHDHATTLTETDCSTIEVVNGANTGLTSFRWIALGRFAA